MRFLRKKKNEKINLAAIWFNVKGIAHEICGGNAKPKSR